ncbi:sugar ABC transporter permease [Paenibacillus sp. FSL P4-0338]|uniref:carbohydrate ABC transporter permease n=2 Tax=Paenibacillus TaxID=44249 RepID=UPI0003E23BD5|nr:sugar ABC transporter permease [Paenibacillus sp. FSL R7-269]ETT48542.1 binding-protein-dependent transport system inner membrane protein [Paenibacillus sp. FSL R7-269]
MEVITEEGTAKRSGSPGISKMRKQSFYDNIAGYLFIAPMLILTVTLVIIPILLSGVISFSNWNFVSGLDGFQFVGLDNYSRLVQDESFHRSLYNNLIMIGVVPVAMFLALVLAVLINKATYFKTFFKVIYFMPFISSFVAIALLWRVLYHPNNGPINGFLRSIGFEHPPMWLADPKYALISVMIIMVWTSLGFNMVIYLAGLQNISRDLYEAADVDGASPLRQFFRITLPMLSPTSFFLLITGVVGSFKVFDLIMVLTGGGPAGSTSVIVYYLYEVAFVNLESGYASAMGIILLILILLVTLFQWVGQKKWVNY